MRTLRSGIVVMSFAATAAAAERRVPFWPDEVPAALQRHVDGVAVLDSVRALGRYHRVRARPAKVIS